MFSTSLLNLEEVAAFLHSLCCKTLPCGSLPITVRIAFRVKIFLRNYRYIIVQMNNSIFTVRRINAFFFPVKKPTATNEKSMRWIWTFEQKSREIQSSCWFVFFHPRQAPLVDCLRQWLWPALLGRYSYKRSSEQTALPQGTTGRDTSCRLERGQRSWGDVPCLPLPAWVHTLHLT